MHAIQVENVSKRYRIGARERDRTLGETVVDALAEPFRRMRSFGRSSHREENSIWALKKVSFDVGAGEVVGIIGRNGAGKSTLLKILSRITEPTEGSATIRGRVASLLEVGTGFHQELTGRENIYLSGAVLGMSRREMDRKFNKIVEFSGVEKFIDTPVKRYSSGMNVRLGFAVAAHLEPEILLVDEVLAVGDTAFQKKCLGKMGDVVREGRTVLFVSHNMAAIRGLCERVLLIAEGRLTCEGSADHVVQEYLAGMQESAETPLQGRSDRAGDGSIRIAGIRVGTRRRPELGQWITGEDCVLELDFTCEDGRACRNVEAAVGILRRDASEVLYMGSKVTRQSFDDLRGAGTFVCTVPRLPLEPGRYLVNAEVKHNGVIADHVARASALIVAEGDYYGTGVIWPYGGFLCDYSWTSRPRADAGGTRVGGMTP